VRHIKAAANMGFATSVAGRWQLWQQSIIVLQAGLDGMLWVVGF